MAPHTTQPYSQPQPSHPYSVASTSQLTQSPIDPKLANLKVVPPARSRPPSLLESPQSYPSGPQADPNQILAVVAKGLESLIDRGTIDARPSRQGVAQPRVGACSACRESKAKCSQGEVCTRCAQNNVECVYPLFAKRGRKRTMTPNMVLLESLHRDVERALRLIATGSSPARTGPGSPHSPSSLTTAAAQHGLRRSLARHGSSQGDSPASTEHTEDGEGDEDEARDGFETVIESPLAVLAHLSSLKLNVSNDEESGSSFLPSEKQNQTAPEQYFATGLYQIRADCEPMLDPILLGLLTEQDLDRLVNLYFTSLRDYCWHLDANIHSPRFLRDTSPFLTTVLALTAAGFCPQSGHLLPGLQSHAMYLSDRVFSEGLKSLEIVQAYCLLVHWAPIANNWGDDRRWGWLGMGLRIATEIRMDKPLNELTFQHYNGSSKLPPNAFTFLAQDRARSWALLGVIELALCVSTGRLGSIVGLNLTSGFQALSSACEPSDPTYNLRAMVALNRVYAKALNLSSGLQEEAGRALDLRLSFNSSWQAEMEGWRHAWPHVNRVMHIMYQHSCTILLSVSLRFRGPVAPVLDECRKTALVTTRLAADWPDASLVYASNALVVNIAYAATLLLRIANSPGQSLTDEERMLCSKVSDALARMGQVRPHCRTLAALHSTRIRTLLAQSHNNTLTANSSNNSSGQSTPGLLPPAGYRLPLHSPPNPANTPGYLPAHPGPGNPHLAYSQPTTIKQELMSGLLAQQQQQPGMVPPPPQQQQQAHPQQPQQQQQPPPPPGAGALPSPPQFSSGVSPPSVQGLFQAGGPGPHLWDFFGHGTGEWGPPGAGQAGSGSGTGAGRGIMLPQVAGPFSSGGQGAGEWADWQQTEPGTWAW